MLLTYFIQDLNFKLVKASVKIELLPFFRAIVVIGNNGNNELSLL